MNKRLGRILISGAILLAAVLIKTDIVWLSPALFILSYIIIGYDVLWKAVRNLFHGKLFDENFLMSLATVGAFFTGEFPEAVGVMLFYQVGELFQSYAVNKSRRSIAELMDIRPDYANIQRDGGLVRVDPDEVKVGDSIVVTPGERVPLDGVVLEGSSTLDTSALTGESVPRTIGTGGEVLSGCINLSGVLTVRVTKEYGESTVSKILDLVENAAAKKSQSENFISKFARVYTPAVVIAAVLLAVIPPLVIPGALFQDWIYRALTFLVVSCPCALVISIPLSFFGGLGGASRSGILIKGSSYLESLAKTEIMVFDKTGTLTRGVFDVQEIRPAGDFSEMELLRLAAYAESFSSHPISLSLKRAYGKAVDSALVSDTQELSGHGVSAMVDGRHVLAGNAKLMADQGLRCAPVDAAGTVVHVAVDGVYAGYILIADQTKADSARAIRDLKAVGVRRTVMLTGDNAATARAVAAQLGLDEAYAELLPAGKVEKVEALLSEKSPRGKLAFAGDGINDAPVLARADIGIAMGALGSDAAIEAADVVIMTDEPSKIASAIQISKKTLNIARQNIVFALAVKLAVLVLSAFGVSTMWEAVFADVGVAVIAILNALRALRTHKLPADAVN
jgi:Cd2+/Zn2+-exporting ATPase